MGRKRKPPEAWQQAMDSLPSPPDHLSARAKSLWHDVIPARAVSPERIAMVRTALEALDRADLAREEIDREGMIFETKTTGTRHLHPAIRAERDARAQFLTSWERLGFDRNPEIDNFDPNAPWPY